MRGCFRRWKNYNLGNFYDKYWMYRLESHGRWYFDTDTKPDKVLEQSPNTDALCPNHIHHWLSYCSSYRSTKSSCGPVKWIPTSQPRCKPGSEPGKCCDHVEVTADENAIQNLNVSGKFSRPRTGPNIERFNIRLCYLVIG